MSEIDDVFAALRELESGEWPRKAANYLHNRLRALRAQGVKPEKPILCNRPGCDNTVESIGQVCPSCLVEAKNSLPY